MMMMNEKILVFIFLMYALLFLLSKLMMRLNNNHTTEMYLMHDNPTTKK